MDGHDAGVDAAAIPQLLQRRVRLLFYQLLQPIQLLAGDLGPPPTAVGSGCDGAQFTSALQEPSNPCRADPVELGDMLPAASLPIAGPHDPFPKIHGVGHAYVSAYATLFRELL